MPDQVTLVTERTRAFGTFVGLFLKYYDKGCSVMTSYIDDSCFVDRINCSLVIPINIQMQSDGVSDIYFDVALVLSK